MEKEVGENATTIPDTRVCQKMVYVKNESKFKLLKTTMITRNKEVAYFIRGKLITDHHLDLKFNNLEELNNMTDFDNLLICQGVTNPKFLEIPSHRNGLKKEKIWRSKNCSLYGLRKNMVGDVICACCTK